MFVRTQNTAGFYFFLNVLQLSAYYYTYTFYRVILNNHISLGTDKRVTNTHLPPFLILLTGLPYQKYQPEFIRETQMI